MKAERKYNKIQLNSKKFPVCITTIKLNKNIVQKP